MPLLVLCVISVIAEILAFTWIAIKARSSGDSEKGIIRRHLPHGAAFILSGVALSSKVFYLMAAALALNILVTAYLLLYGRAISRQAMGQQNRLV
jgi:hypothetical protein